MGKTERLLILEAELKPLVPILAKAGQVILDENVSKYPVFVAHQYEMEIGIPLISKDNTRSNWNINASMLEELSAKSIIHKDKIAEFIKNFKDPQDFVCLFVLSELGAQFVYLPINQEV